MGMFFVSPVFGLLLAHKAFYFGDRTLLPPRDSYFGSDIVRM